MTFTKDQNEIISAVKRAYNTDIEKETLFKYNVLIGKMVEGEYNSTDRTYTVHLDNTLKNAPASAFTGAISRGLSEVYLLEQAFIPFVENIMLKIDSYWSDHQRKIDEHVIEKGFHRELTDLIKYHNSLKSQSARDYGLNTYDIKRALDNRA